MTPESLSEEELRIISLLFYDFVLCYGSDIITTLKQTHKQRKQTNMTLSEQTKVDMDSVENTRMHKFLTMIYEASLTYAANNAPRKYLNLQLHEWFGIQVPEDGYNEDDKEYVFYDAMLQGRTCCATFELKKLMKLDDKSPDYINEYRSFFENKLNLRICQQTIANKTFEPDNPEIRLSMMFTAMCINMMPNVWKKFLSILKVTDSSLSTTDEDVATAVKWLVDNVLFQHEDKDIEEGASTEDNQPSSPTDDPDGKKMVVLKEGETAHVELTPYDYNGKTEQMCAVTLHIGHDNQSCWAFRPLFDKVVPGDYIAKCDVTRAQLNESLYEVHQDPNGDGKYMRRVIPAKVGESVTSKEITIPEGATEVDPGPYYEKMKEVLHHIAELSTVTNGGHTGCIHDPASWAEEFMRNVTALFSFDLTRHIRPDNCKNKFDRISCQIVKRFDDRTGDNTVLSNIGSVLQVIKMLACVRRDNVQDHPTPHGYEYVIDYNKYWSMIKQLYGIDLSDTPKYTNDHRYHLMAALKGAAD